MSLLIKSIDAAITTGSGLAVWSDVPKTNASFQILFSPSDTSTASFWLEYTLNGLDWYAASSAKFGSQSGGAILGVSLPPFIGLRANLTNVGNVTAGTTVTIWIAAA